MAQKKRQFEDLCTLDKEEITDKLGNLGHEVIVKVYMGTSPENAVWLKSVLKQIDFAKEIEKRNRDCIFYEYEISVFYVSINIM